jgi:hypothetical protein
VSIEGASIKRPKDRDSLCIGNLPGRQNPMIYLWNGFDGVVRTLGYFNSDASAEETIDYLWDLAVKAGAEIAEKP